MSLLLLTQSFMNPAAIAYNSGGASVSIAADYTAIFAHSQQNDCPISSCSLMEPGCSTALATQTNVVVSGSPTFGLSAVETNDLGYTLNFRIQ